MIFGNEIGDGLFLWIESDRRIDHRLRVVIGLAAWDQHLHVQFLGCCLIFLPTFRYGQRRPKKRAQLLLARSQEFFDLCGCWHDGQPCDSRTAEQRDELAPFHSITSSAMASKPGGKVRPSVFAVFRLITNSNFVGWTTGKSAGFAPLRIFPV